MSMTINPPAAPIAVQANTAAQGKLAQASVALATGKSEGGSDGQGQLASPPKGQLGASVTVYA
jgi:hypothetical protein